MPNADFTPKMTTTKGKTVTAIDDAAYAVDRHLGAAQDALS
jgi:hypothetical protein